MQFLSIFSVATLLFSFTSGRVLEQRSSENGITTTLRSTAAHEVVVTAKRSGIARTSSPAGCLVVGGSGAYSTFADALKALGSKNTAQCIFLSAGTYKEQVTVDYAGELTIYGSTTE